MFDGIISRVRRTTSTSTIQTDDDGKSLPLPATEKTKWKRRELQLLTAANQISSPAPMSTSQSITGFDNHANVWQSHSLHHPSPSRAGPSQVAWLSSTESVHVVEQPAPAVLAPVPVQRPSISHIHPIGRSVSSPPTSPSYEVSPTDSDSSSSTATPARWGLKLQTNPAYSTSTHSLRLEPRPHSTDVFGYAYSYPLAKQLSPIAEQDYFSPESLRRTKPLPSGSSPSIAFSYTSPSPNGSHISEITRTFAPITPLHSSTFHPITITVELITRVFHDNRSFPRVLAPLHHPPTEQDHFSDLVADTLVHRFVNTSPLHPIRRPPKSSPTRPPTSLPRPASQLRRQRIVAQTSSVNDYGHAYHSRQLRELRRQLRLWG